MEFLISYYHPLKDTVFLLWYTGSPCPQYTVQIYSWHHSVKPRVRSRDKSSSGGKEICIQFYTLCALKRIDLRLFFYFIANHCKALGVWCHSDARASSPSTSLSFSSVDNAQTSYNWDKILSLMQGRIGLMMISPQACTIYYWWIDLAHIRLQPSCTQSASWAYGNVSKESSQWYAPITLSHFIYSFQSTIICRWPTMAKVRFSESSLTVELLYHGPKTT